MIAVFLMSLFCNVRCFIIVAVLLFAVLYPLQFMRSFVFLHVCVCVLVSQDPRLAMVHHTYVSAKRWC